MKGTRKQKLPPVVSVQLPGEGGRYEQYHRIEADSGSADDLRAALDAIIAEPVKHRIGVKQKQTFRRAPARKPDEEQLPGVAVDTAVEKAFAA